jgi:hypothetical protein
MKKILLSIQTLFGIFILALLINPSYATEDYHDHSSHSENGTYAHLDIKVHFDKVIEAAEANERINEAYSHSHFDWGIGLDNNFSIHSSLKLEGEPSGHTHGATVSSNSGDRFFDKHPLSMAKLTLDYKNEDFAAYVGKFNPIVGFDYHQFPGVFTYQTIESYAIRERLGLGASFKNDLGDYGQHQLDVSSFFADTTALSNSILYKRGRTTLADGGVSNTEDLSSFAISLGGQDFYSLDNNIVEGLSYRIGYAKQAKGSNNNKDEHRHSLSLGYQQKISQDLSAKLIFERMDINHLSGEAAHDRTYNTLTGQLNYNKWNTTISYTDINNTAGEADENHDGFIRQVSIGYRFDNGVNFDIGHKHSDEDNEVKKRIGAVLSYDYEF